MTDDPFRAPQAPIADTGPRKPWGSRGFIIGVIVILLAIGYFFYAEGRAQQQYVLKAKLSKVVSALDPVKTAIAMASQDKGKLPRVTTVVTPANQGQRATPDWAALGFDALPSLPREIGSLSVAPEGEIVVTLANLREEIDATEVRAKMAKDAQGVSWTYQCTSENAVLKRFFRC